MPKEHAENMRRAVDAVNRGDRSAFLALCDSGMENVPPRNWPESEPIRGGEAVWDFYVEGNAPWDGVSYECVEIIEAGDDKLVVDLRGEMRGKTSGVQVPWAFWLVVTHRDGKALRHEWFADRAEAFGAVGVAE
jgi:ketosteroid isomerase-like protein